MPYLGVNPREMKTYADTKICKQMFKQLYSELAKATQYPTTGNLWHMHAMKY